MFLSNDLFVLSDATRVSTSCGTLIVSSVRTGVAVALALVFAGSASAQSLNGSASCGSFLDANPTSMQSRCTTVLLSGQTPGDDQIEFQPGTLYGQQVQAVGTSGSVTAGYRMRAGYGDIGAEAYAASSGSSAFNQAGERIGVINVFASAVATASFEDQISVSSARLQLGDPVALRWTGTISATAGFSRTGTFGNALFSAVLANVGLDVSDEVTIRTLLRQSFCFGADLTGCTFVEGSSASFEILVDARVGDVITLRGDLDAEVTFGSQAIQPDTSYSADAASTAYNSLHGYLDAQTAGVTLVSASGHDYAAPNPVPEPSTWALLLTGLVPLLVRTAKLRRFCA